MSHDEFVRRGPAFTVVRTDLDYVYREAAEARARVFGAARQLRATALDAMHPGLWIRRYPLASAALILSAGLAIGAALIRNSASSCTGSNVRPASGSGAVGWGWLAEIGTGLIGAIRRALIGALTAQLLFRSAPNEAGQQLAGRRSELG